MTRSKRFVASLLTSYAAIGVNSLYTIASIPLVLHYLGSKSEYGTFVLVTQLGGYLMLLEFGMTGSVARSLSDHKDRMEDGIYGSILRTGGRVFAIQGCVVTILGLVMAWIAPPLLNVEPYLRQPFTNLMAVQALVSGAKLAAGSLASPLWCHQRLDLSNLAGSVSLVVSFAVLWVGLQLGWWLYSLSIAMVAGFVVGLVITWLSCHRLGFYPPREFRGRFDSKLFRELFHFGGGLFLMNLGTQLTSASQVIVISRILGTGAAADWSVATKIFAMAQQFVSRVLDSSAGGLADMVVRGESATLHKRFRDIVSVSAVMAVAASAGIALTNGPFIELWTSARVTWEPWNNFLLACVLFSTASTRCHTSLVGITKQIRGMKLIYLLEGVAFVTLAVMLCRSFWLTGILLAALACNIGITGTYSVSRTASYFGVSRLAVLGWMARPAGILILTAGLFSISCLPQLTRTAASVRFALGAMSFCLIVVPAIWFLGISPALRSELTQLLSKISGKVKSALHMA